MNTYSIICTRICVAVTLSLIACRSTGEAEVKTIAFVTGSSDNPENKVLEKGASEEVDKLNKANGKVSIELKLLNARDTEIQVNLIQALIASKVDGIAVRTKDAAPLVPLFAQASDKTIHVAIIDRDAAETRDIKCDVVIGMGDEDRGKLVMRELIHALAGEIQCTTIEIFGGDPMRMHERVTGAIAEASAHNIDLKEARDVVYCPGKRVGDCMANAWHNRQDICAWAMVSGWEIFSLKDAFDWAPKNMFVVAYDDFVEDGFKYVESGRVRTLFVDDFEKWGIQAVDSIYEAIVSESKPENRFIEIQPRKVTKETLKQFAADWSGWTK